MGRGCYYQNKGYFGYFDILDNFPEFQDMNDFPDIHQLEQKEPIASELQNMDYKAVVQDKEMDFEVFVQEIVFQDKGMDFVVFDLGTGILSRF